MNAEPLRHTSRLGQIHLEFEKGWRDGLRPKAERYLRSIPEQERGKLLKELLALELAWRRRRGEAIPPEEYLRRFPEFADVVRAVVTQTPSGETQAYVDSQLDVMPETVNYRGGKATPIPDGEVHGRRLGQYLLLEEIAAGGMGVVYKARQLGLDRVVALKMIRAGSYAGADELVRFRTEAQAVARLQHPHIVQVYEIAEADGHPFISMEYMGGGTLAQKLAAAPLAPLEAARLVETLARAMHAAHQERIVHRDLKPANVMLTADGVAKISDFGLAKRLDVDSGQTHSGAVLGTPSYMAPEQAAGHGHDVGPQADVYSLGAILYEALAGRPPFRAASILETLELVRTQEPVPPRYLQPRLPRDLETICLKCLEKEPYKRYASVDALADDLGRFIRNEPIQARPVRTAERLWKWAKRRPSAAGLVAVSLLAFVLLAAGGVWSYVQIADGQDREKARADDAETQTKIADGQRSLAESRRLEALTQAKLAEERRKEAQAKTELARERLVQYRHTAYGAQLSQAAMVATSNPNMALELLEDNATCPFDLRDFTWRLLRQQTQRRQFISSDIPEMKTATVPALDVSPDGSTLAGCTITGDVFLADVAARRVGQLIVKLGQDTQAVRVRFVPGGKKLVVVRHDASVVLVNMETKQTESTLAHDRLAPTPPPFSLTLCPLAFPADGKKMALAGLSKDGKAQVRVWDLESGQLLANLNGHDKVVTSVDFSADGKTLVSGSADGTAILWDVKTQKAASTLRGHKGTIWDVSITPSGAWVATAGADGLVRIWNKGKLLRVSRPEVGPVWAVTFMPGGFSFAVAGPLNEAVKILDFANDRELLRLRCPGMDRAGLRLLSGDRLGFSVYGHWEIWDVGARRGRAVLPAGEATANPIFFKDGRLLAARADGRIAVVEAATGKIVRHLDAKKEIFQIALAPGGKMLAVNFKKTPGTQLWNPDTGEALALLPGESFRLAFAPDGKTLAVFSGESQVKLWDMTTLHECGRFDTHNDAIVMELDYSSDGRYLATGGLDGKVILREPATGKELFSYQAHVAGIQALAFSPDGKLLATGGSDRIIKLWDVAKRREVGILTGHQNFVLELHWTPDGKTLASLGLDETVRFWDVAQARELSTVRPRFVAIHMAISPAGDALALVGAGLLEIWDAPVAPLDRLWLRQAVFAVHALALAPDDKTLAIVGPLTPPNKETSRGFLDLWDIETGQRRTRLVGDLPVLNAAAFTPDGKIVAVAGIGPDVWLFDVDNGKVLHRWAAHADNIDALAFSPDGESLFSGSAKGDIKVWHINLSPAGGGERVWGTATERMSLKGCAAAVHRLAFLDGGKLLVSHEKTGAVRFWDLAARSELSLPKGEEVPNSYSVLGKASFAFAPDGKSMATLSNQVVRFWSLPGLTPEARKLAVDSPRTFNVVAFSTDGKLATGGVHGELTLWDAQRGKEISSVRAGITSVTNLLFTHDGTRIVASHWYDTNRNNTVTIWKVAGKDAERSGKPR